MPAVLVLAVLGLLFWQQRSGSHRPRDVPASRSTASVTTHGTDPASGLPYIDPVDLPIQAQQTLRLIDAGGPFPYEQDGVAFENREGILPRESRGYYREYTVETPGSGDRGARRIVNGQQGELYWSGDHYRSFARIRK